VTVHNAVRNVRIFPRLSRQTRDSEEATLPEVVRPELVRLRLDDVYAVDLE
jgi:hypothetical protein